MISSRALIAFKPFRYLFAGITGLVTNLGALFILVSLLHVWYLAGTIISFFISSGVSFIMQKLLTFSDRTVKGAHIQLGIFFGVALFNLGMNTLLMYVAVGRFAIQYLIAQFLVNAIIAVYSYFLYKHIVFRRT